MGPAKTWTMPDGLVVRMFAQDKERPDLFPGVWIVESEGRGCVAKRTGSCSLDNKQMAEACHAAHLEYLKAFPGYKSYYGA